MWRRGSVVESRLLNLTAAALIRPPHLEEFAGRLSSSRFAATDLDTFVDKAL
jgi:6-phosphogluconate dehydrogenase